MFVKNIVSYLLIYYIVSIYATDDNVTIIYDETYDDDITKLRQNSTLELLHDVRFIFVSKNNALPNISKAMFDESESIFSFLDVAVPPAALPSNHFYLGTSLLKLESWVNNTDQTSCFKYTESYKKTLISLVYSVFLKGVVIISDQGHCSTHFGDDIVDQLKRDEETKQISLNLHRIKLTLHPRHRAELRQIFYLLKTAEVSLIVLLIAPEYMEDVFRHASVFDLTGPAQIWLIPNYYDGASSSFIPMRIITLSEDEDGIVERKYTNLQTTIPELLIKKRVNTTACFRTEFPLSCQKSILYETLQRNEHHDAEEQHMTVRYRNLAEGVDWTSVHAELKEEEFIIQHNTIPILRSVSGENVRRSMRAVTILDSPYTIEEIHVFDPVLKSCKVGIICRKPIASEFNNTAQYEITCCVGFVIDFFQLIMDELNLDVEMHIVGDGKYGMYEHGQWNGLIGELENGTADIAVAGLTITSERSKVIEYTVPYMEARMGILVKPQIVKLEFLNWDFIAPLSTELQLALWVVIVGAMVLNYIFENNLYTLSLTDSKFKYFKYYPTFESMTYISGVTLQRDLGGVNPVRAGARVSAIVFAFGMVIVITTYTAVLAAQSVQNQEKNPFLGSKDPRMRNPENDFTFGTLKSSSYESFFQNGETEVLKRMGRFMGPYNVETTEEGFQKVSNGTLNAFLDDYHFLLWHALRDQYCSLRLIKDTLLVTGYGFALNKKLKWSAELFNTIILRKREDEEVIPLLSKWYIKRCNENKHVENSSLGVADFGGLIILLITVAVVSFPLLIPERIYYKYMNEKLTETVKNIFWKNCGEIEGNASMKVTVTSVLRDDDSV